MQSFTLSLSFSLSLSSSSSLLSAPSVRALKPAFFKAVDMSGSYRPLIYETDKWPVPNASCPPNANPYDSCMRKNGKVCAQPSRAATGARLTQDLGGASLPPAAAAAAAAAPSTAAAQRKPGYCECCVSRYEDLKMVKK